MKHIPWDSYQIFLAVARTGSLSAAADRIGLSSATIGRRMLELERQMECGLFVRSQAGYSLTGGGQALLDHLAGMEVAGREMEIWNAGLCGAVRVRICAGSWCARFLMRNLNELVRTGDRHGIDISIGEERASLAHRSADIGIRAFEPEETNLAAVRLPEVAYAVYAAVDMPVAHAERWIAVSEEVAVSRYLRYPHEKWPNNLIATVSRAEGLRHSILSGAGVGVLPCFVGDVDPDLRRVGEEIAELRHRSWLVMNNEDRHRPEIRAVVDRMTVLFRRHVALFEGRCGLGEPALSNPLDMAT
ncbi:LysR family transcriptional regulator [Pleomorphomonas oryzae]|uniref:LysR family transcriptional regulator n=1 Tax=Pleomorphomonas oryzae TaxID=261934 RepID=UPI000421CD32|nr:LysR family transcriptional regulator [Pleomorphomonas oryzae]